MYIKKITGCDVEIYMIQSLKQNNMVAMPNI